MSPRLFSSSLILFSLFRNEFGDVTWRAGDLSGEEPEGLRKDDEEDSEEDEEEEYEEYEDDDEGRPKKRAVKKKGAVAPGGRKKWESNDNDGEDGGGDGGDNEYGVAAKVVPVKQNYQVPSSPFPLALPPLIPQTNNRVTIKTNGNK